MPHEIVTTLVMNQPGGHVCCSRFDCLRAPTHPIMNPAREPAPFPDSTSVIPELIFGNYWSPEAVSRLIRSKCAAGETPAFLFLGRKEAALLPDHLAEVFGAEAVATLHETYYMGLKVVEIQAS